MAPVKVDKRTMGVDPSQVSTIRGHPPNHPFVTQTTFAPYVYKLHKHYAYVQSSYKHSYTIMLIHCDNMHYTPKSASTVLYLSIGRLECMYSVRSCVFSILSCIAVVDSTVPATQHGPWQLCQVSRQPAPPSTWQPLARFPQRHPTPTPPPPTAAATREGVWLPDGQ